MEVIEELTRANSLLLPHGFWSLNSGTRLASLTMTELWAWSLWCVTLSCLVMGRGLLLFQLCMSTSACGSMHTLAGALVFRGGCQIPWSLVLCAAQHGCWDLNSGHLWNMVAVSVCLVCAPLNWEQPLKPFCLWFFSCFCFWTGFPFVSELALHSLRSPGCPLTESSLLSADITGVQHPVLLEQLIS